MKIKTIVSAVALAGASVAMTPASAGEGSQKQYGSAVIYPLFQLASQGYTSVIRLVNNHPTDDVTVHLVRVCGGIKSFGAEGFCDASNRQVTLSHNQVKVMNVENFFGINNTQCETKTGYVVAYAVDAAQASAPIEWNWLSGSTYQRRTGAVAFPNATAGAQAFTVQGDPQDEVPDLAANPDAPEDGNILVDANGDELEGGAFPILAFDDSAYAELPDEWSSDFVATTNASNAVNGRRSALSLATIGIRAGFQNDPTVVALDWYNEPEDIFSTSLEYVCHIYKELQTISSSFKMNALGSFYGTLYVTSFDDEAIIAQIKELEPNRETLRNMFHDDDLVSATFQGR